MKKQKQPSEKAKATVEAFKKIKAPLWSRWLGDFRAWNRARKARKEWIHVGTATMVAGTTHGKRCYAFFHFYQKGTGQRKFVFDKGGISWMAMKEYRAYHEAAIPWREGKFTNSIIKEWCERTQKEANKN